MLDAPRQRCAINHRLYRFVSSSILRRKRSLLFFSLRSSTRSVAQSRLRRRNSRDSRVQCSRREPWTLRSCRNQLKRELTDGRDRSERFDSEDDLEKDCEIFGWLYVLHRLCASIMELVTIRLGLTVNSGLGKISIFSIVSTMWLVEFRHDSTTVDERRFENTRLVSRAKYACRRVSQFISRSRGESWITRWRI